MTWVSLLVVSALLAPRATVSGRVVDARTSAPIADARVTLQLDTERPSRPAPRAVQTDATGAFTFTDVAPGRHILAVSTVGYVFFDRVIDVSEGAQEFIVALAEGAGTFRDSVQVSAPRGQASGDAAARLELGPAALQDVRGVATDDPMRAVHTLPGVVAGEDFQADFSVRGTPFHQIGIVVDGVPVRTLMHAVQGVENTGSVSMISTDVLDRATLLPGVHPRTGGDWLGPTLSFDMREGSRDRASVRAAITGTSASAIVEGPLSASKRGSVLVAVRRSYLDWLIRKIEPEFDRAVSYWDGQFKLVFDVTPAQQLQLLVIGGDADYRQLSIVSDLAVSHGTSGSTHAQFSWRSTGRRWIATQRVTFDGGDYRNTGSRGDLQSLGYWQSVTWRSDLAWSAGRDWMLEAGAMHERGRGFEVQAWLDPLDPGVAPREHVTGGFAQLVRRTTAMSFTAGVRVSHHRILDHDVRSRSTANTAAAPWLLVERRTGPWTWRAGAGGSSQFPNPLFQYFPRDPVAVERAWSIDAGVERELGGQLRVSLNVFRRDEAHVAWQSADAPAYSTTLSGRAHGVDVAITRRPGRRVSGWAAYTWARTTMTDELGGETFPGDADQRHTLNAVATWRLSYRMNVGAKLRVGSNVPLIGYFDRAGDVVTVGNARNRVRLPVYSRLDVRASRSFVPGRRRVTLFVEVLNVLDRENIGRAAPLLNVFDLTVSNYAERLVPRVPSAGLLIEF